MISFSQSTLFWTCPRTWYNKYVLDLPRIESLEFANRGSTVHKCLENYYPDKTKSIETIKVMFDNYWFNEYKLHNTFLWNKYTESWNMVLRGIELDLDVTDVEMELLFDDVKGYIDIVVHDKNGNLILIDWKTSTRSHQNEHEYVMQLKYYCWLYHRKYQILPNVVGVYYLKYKGEFGYLEIKPTMQDVNNAQKFHEKTFKKMQYYKNNPDKLPLYNFFYEWSPYKHLWKIPKNWLVVNLQISGNYIYFKNEIPEFLLNHIKKKFSYDKIITFKIKGVLQRNKQNVSLYNGKYKRIPLGFLESLKKTFKDYCSWKNLELKISINDRRYFNLEDIKMPDKLLSGKILRDYQNEAVEKYIKGPDFSMLEKATGSGKSLVISEIVRRISKLTLVVVDQTKLMYQLKKTFEEELGIEIGQIGDGKKEIKDVTVATIQTLNLNIDKFSEYLSKVYLFICDEAHHIASDSYTNLCHNLKNTKRRLGVTATAKRTDSKFIILESNTGKVIYNLETIELIEEGYLMKPIIKFIKYNNTKEEITQMEKDSSTGLINESPNYHLFYNNFIINNKKRNEKIIEICLNNPNKKILILVNIKTHGELLKSLMPNSDYLNGELSTKKRDKIYDDFVNGNLNILIGTSSIFAEGVDIPSLDIILNASCNKTAIRSIQILGRVLRLCEGKKEAYYYDLYDSVSIFRPATLERIKIFKKKGHEVIISQ